MSTIPTVSVIVPTFNSGTYLAETLSSILDQQYQDFEIVVVDDASTDNTGEVVRCLNSGKIVYIRLPGNHGGPSKPRNVGIKNARGKYIAIFDSDDLMLPGRLETAVAALDSFPQLGMTFCSARQFDDLTGEERSSDYLEQYDRFNSLKTQRLRSGLYFLEKGPAYDCLFFENFILTSSVTVRKEVFEDVGLFDESITNADDWDMWFRIADKYHLGFIDASTVVYRIRSGSISARGSRLAENKVRVLRKRLQQRLTDEIRRQAHALIAEIYAQMGYECRCADQMALARKHFMASLREKPDVGVMFQWMVTFLGNDAIEVLRAVRRKFGKKARSGGVGTCVD